MSKCFFRLLSAAGLVCLLLCCAACSGGKTPVSQTDALTRTDAPTQTAADDVAASPVEEFPIGYMLRCQRTESDDGSALEGWVNDDPSRSYFQPVLMRATASAVADGTAVFDIVIRTEETKANLRHAFTGQIVARKGSAWLIALRDPGISDTYYLYGAVGGSLTPLGRDVSVAVCGDAIFVLPSADGSFSPRVLAVYDWTGKRTGEFAEIKDMRRYGDALYLLSAVSDDALERIDAASCAAPTEALSPERICTFPGYRAEFIANTQDGLFLFHRSSGRIVTCNIAGAAETAAALQNGGPLPAAALSERCGLFTVVLPESWLGKYVCETTASRITFYHKASREAGMNGYLFSLYAVEASEAEDYVYEAPMVANYNDNGDLRCVFLGGPSDVQYADAVKAEYDAMRADRFTVARSLSMEHAYSETWLNYQGFQWGDYRGYDEAGGVYTLRVDLITDRSFEGRLYYGPQGADGETPLHCAVPMENGTGTLSWYAETASGAGGVTVKNDQTLLLTLTDVPDGWTAAAGEELALTVLR